MHQKFAASATNTTLEVSRFIWSMWIRKSDQKPFAGTCMSTIIHAKDFVIRTTLWSHIVVQQLRLRLSFLIRIVSWSTAGA
jgi:hypothetical protein